MIVVAFATLLITPSYIELEEINDEKSQKEINDEKSQIFNKKP